MASSVSSESTFSAASITISKHHNQLKGDIVEVLQCLKSLIHQDLLFWDVITATQDEEDLNLADQDPPTMKLTQARLSTTGRNGLGIG